MPMFKLGKMTLGSLFKKPETVLYPLETKPAPAGLKGHIEIVAEDCILCGMCDRSCPTSCLTVDKAAHTWSINRYSCIQCAYCTTVCPKKCLAMKPGYAPAASVIAADVFEVPEQAKPAKKAVSKEASAASDKPKLEKPAAAAAEAAPKAEAAQADARPLDTVLEAKIALMDEASAAKVRAVLTR